MVDVSDKPDSRRRSVAAGIVRMKRHTVDLIRDGKISKGEVLAVARVAGIMAAKNTSSLIPLCHPIPLTSVGVDFTYLAPPAAGIRVQATASTVGKTGVEMEALVAVSAAALTIYDMCKAVDREMTISEIQLLEKEGGKSGTFKRPTAERPRTRESKDRK